MSRVKPGDIARTTSRKVTCLNIILSCNVPGLNSPNDFNCLWSLVGSKTYETSYFPGSEIIIRLNQGRETSAPIDKSKEKINVKCHVIMIEIKAINLF
jgi:hypothetical protein